MGITTISNSYVSCKMKGDSCLNMKMFLPFLCFLCATHALAIFEGTCLPKDPPPGALILSPGSDLVLTCSGHVTVDGVKVRNSSSTKGVAAASQTTENSTINSGVLMENEKHAVENPESQIRQNGSLRHRDRESTASPTAHMVQSTSVPSLLKAEEMDKRSDYQEGDEEEGSLRPLWKRDPGATTWKRGDTVSLSSVSPTDSGTYSCHYGGRERFSLKVIIADPPEKPSLSCSKKSATSEILCESTPLSPVTVRPDCYLLLSKGKRDTFLPLQCSYSDQASRCRCILPHSDNEQRIIHLAYLCVASVAGNATSSLLYFLPYNVLKPDPPSKVSVLPVEGQGTRLTVTWSVPATWKSEDYFYELNYEIKYRRLGSSFEQIKKSIARRYFIRDAMPGAEYVIQLRAKEEFDGLWSDWGAPVYATSWTAPLSTTTMIPFYEYMESSGTDEYVIDVAATLSGVSTQSAKVPANILWIFCSFALFSVILAAFTIRHKDRCMKKVRSLGFITQWGPSPLPPPAATTAPEGQALVTFGLPSNGKTLSEVEDREEESDEQHLNKWIEVNKFLPAEVMTRE